MRNENIPSTKRSKTNIKKRSNKISDIVKAKDEEIDGLTDEKSDQRKGFFLRRKRSKEREGELPFFVQRTTECNIVFELVVGPTYPF